MTLWSAGLKVLAPGEVMLPPRDLTVDPLNWRLRWPPSHFLTPLKREAAGAVTAAGMSGPYYHGTLHCCSTSEARESTPGIQETLRGVCCYHHALWWATENSSSSAQAAHRPRFSGNEGCGHPRSEVLAEGQGNTKWVVEEGSYRYQLWPQVTDSTDWWQRSRFYVTIYRNGDFTDRSISSLFCYEYVCV